MAKETDFFEKVYKVVRQIPHGRVSTYGAIAKSIGSAQSARVVGYAMNKASGMDHVPAHRVVNRKGLLTGKHHFPGTHVMQQMLENEGIKIEKDQIQDFKNLFWDPIKAL